MRRSLVALACFIALFVHEQAAHAQTRSAGLGNARKLVELSKQLSVQLHELQDIRPALGADDLAVSSNLFSTVQTLRDDLIHLVELVELRDGMVSIQDAESITKALQPDANDFSESCNEDVHYLNGNIAFAHNASLIAVGNKIKNLVTDACSTASGIH